MLLAFQHNRRLVLTSVLVVVGLSSGSSIHSQDFPFRMQVISQVNGVRVQTDIPGGRVASFGANGDFQVDALIPLRNGGLLEVPGGRFAVTEGGLTGVGIPSPSSRLHLGVPASTDPISAMSIDVGTFGTGGNAQASYYFRVRDIGANAGSAFMIRGDGNVGIGSDAPGQKLTVAGTIYSASGGFTFPDASAQTTGGAATYTTTCVGNKVLSGTPVSICHLNLPAGAYRLESSSKLFNSSNDYGANNNRQALCGFTGDLLYAQDVAGEAEATLALHAVLSIQSGGIDLNCSTGQPGILVYERRLTAIELKGTVVVQ